MTEKIDELKRKKDIEADLSRFSLKYGKAYLHDIHFLKYINQNIAVKEYTANKYKKPIVVSYNQLVELFRLNLITTIRNGCFSLEFIYQKLLNESPIKFMTEILNYYNTDMRLVKKISDDKTRKLIVNVFDSTSPSDLSIDEYDVLKTTRYKTPTFKSNIIYRNNKMMVPLLTTYGLQENLNYYQTNRHYLIGKLFNSSDGSIKLPRIPSNEDNCIIEFTAVNKSFEKLNKYRTEFKIIANKNQSIKLITHNSQYVEKKVYKEVIVKNLIKGDKISCYSIKKITGEIDWVIKIFQPRTGSEIIEYVEPIINSDEGTKFKYIKYLNLHALLKIGFISNILLKEINNFFIYYPKQINNLGENYYNVRLTLPSKGELKGKTFIMRFGDIKHLNQNKYFELLFDSNNDDEIIDPTAPIISKSKSNLLIYSRNGIKFRRNVKKVKLPLNKFKRGDYIKLICREDNTELIKDKKIDLNKINVNKTKWIAIINTNHIINDSLILDDENKSDRLSINYHINKNIILGSDILNNGLSKINSYVFEELKTKSSSVISNIFNITERDNNSILYVKRNNIKLDFSELAEMVLFKAKMVFKSNGLKLGILDEGYNIINNRGGVSNIITSRCDNDVVYLTFYNKKINPIIIIS